MTVNISQKTTTPFQTEELGSYELRVEDWRGGREEAYGAHSWVSLCFSAQGGGGSRSTSHWLAQLLPYEVASPSPTGS